MQDLSSGEGRTVLFVSHNMASVQNLCTRGIVLENGSIAFNGGIELCIREYLMSGNSYEEVSILENEKRLGGNYFRFTGVKYEDFYNNEIITPQSGMNLKIKIFFNCVKNFKNVEIRLQFKDRSGYIVATLNNYHTDFLFDFDKGNNVVVCNIFNMPFIKGNYLLNLRAVDFSKKTILDEVNECKMVTIESGDFFSTGKLPTVNQGVLINHNWEICV